MEDTYWTIEGSARGILVLAALYGGNALTRDVTKEKYKAILDRLHEQNSEGYYDEYRKIERKKYFNSIISSAVIFACVYYGLG